MSDAQYELCKDERGQMGPTPTLPMFLIISGLIAIIVTDEIASGLGYSAPETYMIAIVAWILAIACFRYLVLGIQGAFERVMGS